MKRVSILFVAASLCASGLAVAGSADVKVTGLIKPGACMPTLSGGGLYDFGTIGTRQLSRERNSRFNSDYQALTVVCDTPTRFGIRAYDSRAASAATDNFLFGLGMSGHKPIGNYRLALQGASIEVDGSKSVSRLFSNDGGANWRREDGLVHTLISNSRTNSLHSFAPAGSSLPMPIQRLSADLRVELFISPLSDLDVADGIQLDGASTLEVHYL